MFIFIKKNQNILFFSFLFSLLFFIFCVYFYKSTFSMLGNKYMFRELFINYSGGFIRRGILGEIFIKLNYLFNISPYIFFSPIFIFLNLAQLFLFYKLLNNYKNAKILCLVIIFSPALILFSIYDINTYFAKDIFAKCIILAHSFFILKKVNNNLSINSYNKFLIFFLIPILFFNILNHELQFFFISVHMLLTLLVNYNYNGHKSYLCLKYYLVLLIPFLIILFTPTSFEKVGLINDSVRNFDVRISDQHAGNFNLMIGAFIKWHFLDMGAYNHDVFDFINLFICLLLSLILFYSIFHYLIENNVYEIHPFIKKYYLLMFLPCLGMFISVIDHGRTINIILTHLIAFYLVLKIKNKRFEKIVFKFNKNFIIKFLFLLFSFFYIFLWYLPVGAGFDGVGTFSNDDMIFKNTLLNEIINLFMIVYNFIDSNLINLPRIVV